MKVVVLPGDGCGPEVAAEAVRVLSEVSPIFDLDVQFEEALIGGVAIRKSGSPLPEETATLCHDADAVFLGAVGSPEFDHLKPEERPEKGLLQLRKSLGGFANLRPAKAFGPLVDSSPLRREVFDGTDLLIVRELLGGIYFGEPRGFTEDGAFNTMTYRVEEIERVARVAFEAARERRGKVTSVDKANVLETSQLWRETVTRVADEFTNIELEHVLVDSCAMHLVTNPTRFDVILTENLFGDILSDEAAVLTGSLGMLGSATIGGEIDLYEPIHGSAPDIAGKGIANPIGAIASIAMMLRYTFRNAAAARAIEDAIERVLADGYRTSDLQSTENGTLVSTQRMGELISVYAIESANIRYAYHAV